PPVRAGTDADIVAVAPICEVVPGFVAAARMVGYLIGGKAFPLQPCQRPFEELRLQRFLGQREIATRDALLEHRAGLDGELIERDMACGEAERRLELRLPFRQRLLRPRIDKIEGEAVEGVARNLERAQGFRRIVLAPEEAERLVVQRLDAQRDAVD